LKIKRGLELKSIEYSFFGIFENKMPTYSEEMSNFVVNLNYNDIPQEVVYKAKLHLLDSLGVALSSSQNPIITKTILETVKDLNTNEESTIIGSSQSSSPGYAAFANASMIHGQDFDDTHRLGVVHASACVVPTALACGEVREISGKLLLEAMILGYEMFARIGMAANERFHKKGMHATPLCGIFVASLIAGKIQRQSIKELVNAMGICGSQAAGVQQFLIDGSWVKIIHPGWACYSGIVASLLASHGFIGPSEIFEGELGFFSCHLGLENCKIECLTENLGEVWETLNMSIKRYPCCHAIHTFIDGVFYLQEKHNIEWQKIKHIMCHVNPLGSKIVCEPIEIKRKPKTPYGARFSLPYAIAISLLEGELGLEQFSEQKYNDKRVIEMTSKIDCVKDASLPRTGGNVVIEMDDGKKYQYIKEFPVGSPQYPLNEEEVKDKFRSNTRTILDHKRVEDIIKVALNLEDTDSICKLMTLLR